MKMKGVKVEALRAAHNTANKRLRSRESKTVRNKKMFQHACREATSMELILVGEIHLSSKNTYISALLVLACLMREGCIY
jgi:23S rRNA maturation mini-RNase III